ncbi:MAG: hypothetical protein ACUVXA_13230 [Candidatus Jordarchaeum sp.]|uniref:hypothetical protein n=1 Tax=Candidatus Jordarchaeum sp. TaxID=2823881 RepID=UPI00404A10CF
MPDSEKRDELKKILRKAVSALGDISDKIDDVTSVLSKALTLAEYKEKAIIPEEIVETRKESYEPVPITFEKKEERVAEVSRVVARPINSKFKTLESLISEGTHIKSMASELDGIKDWVMGLSPTFSPILYQIDQWSRKLKNYPYEKLSDQDGGELMYSIHDWKVKLSKV